MMENLDNHLAEVSIDVEKPIEGFLKPFEKVTLLRPMKLFKRILGLEVNVPSHPNLEFLVQLMTEYSSHQAIIRASAGNQFKNFENLIRSKNKSSTTTKLLLSRKFGISTQDLVKLSHSSNDGPLMPQLLDAFHFIEGVYLKTYSSLESGNIICPHCKSHLTANTKEWWGSQRVKVGEAEYYFTERLLKAVIGGYLVAKLFNQSSFQNHLPSTLVEPKHHPIGNWLRVVMGQYGCENLSELSLKLELQNFTISHALLKKWSSGQVLMPFYAAEKIIEKLPNKKTLQISHLISRVLALAVDFVSSVANDNQYFRRALAQEVILQRVLQLELKVKLHNEISGR